MPGARSPSSRWRSAPSTARNSSVGIRRRSRLAQLGERLLLVVGALAAEAGRDRRRRAANAARSAPRATASCRGSRSRCASTRRRSRRPAGPAIRAARRRSARRCARTPSTRNATGSDGRSRSRGRPPAGRPCRAARSRPSTDGSRSRRPTLMHVALRDPELRPGAVVRGVAVRHDGVQAVVAARQLDDDENALGMLLDAGALRAPAPPARRTCGSRTSGSPAPTPMPYSPRARKSRREHEQPDRVH